MSAWYAFNGIDTVDPLPAERRKVLVQIAGATDGSAPSVAVGYLRYGAGDKDSPFFVVPGFGRDFRVTHWSDSLGDEFSAPLWNPPQPTQPTREAKSHARLEWENQELRRMLALIADDVGLLVDQAREMSERDFHAPSDPASKETT